ncbi:transcriptional antiterminator [Streptococcus criceti]|uniref:Transcription antiterminator LicT n=1 Tax=Streptococcus criceti HS-6 TaxID=873449 RepID=G5JPF5_STRCG|nr:PRD domain-containing protein [Streptococcus criceti]EHI73310.1 putative transcription antiterminator LicT [Streptococcus criceti HS-6]SUN37436.1 transcriptional antiterminator [Streptococcus criceti]
MKIERVYNNNVVQVTDKQHEEIIMGKGLGFQKKPGDDVDVNKIEKRFILQESDQDMIGELSRVYQDLTSQEINLVLTIIERGQEVLKQTFEISLYIALADHLQYAIQRTRDGISLQNPLAWEIRKFYPKEYELGQESLKLIESHIGLSMEASEAASIALHFINAQKDGSLIEASQQVSQIVINCLEIVRLHFGHLAAEDSVSYNRFVTHLQYFAQRVVSGSVQGNNDDFLYDQVKANYQEAFACTQKIKDYIEGHFAFQMSKDEQVYLTIHIQRQNES